MVHQKKVNLFKRSEGRNGKPNKAIFAKFLINLCYIFDNFFDKFVVATDQATDQDVTNDVQHLISDKIDV